MNARIKLAAPLLLVSVGALAATGYATRSTEVTQAQAPADTMQVAPAAHDAYVVPAAHEDMTPVVQEPATAPAVTHHAAPRMEVIAPRPSDDELIRNAVMDRLSQDARLAGRIGVESYRHTVSLTGRVSTTMQIERAEMLARSVDGVRDVDNRLTARVGQI